MELDRLQTFEKTKFLYYIQGVQGCLFVSWHKNANKDCFSWWCSMHTYFLLYFVLFFCPIGNFSQSRHPTLINYKAHAGSLTCVRDHFYVCVYTRGLGTLTASQHIFDWKTHHFFYCAPDGIRTSGFQIWSLTCPLSHPVTTPMQSLKDLT